MCGEEEGQSGTELRDWVRSSWVCPFGANESPFFNTCGHRVFLIYTHCLGLKACGNIILSSYNSREFSSPQFSPYTGSWCRPQLPWDPVQEQTYGRVRTVQPGQSPLKWGSWRMHGSRHGRGTLFLINYVSRMGFLGSIL